MPQEPPHGKHVGDLGCAQALTVSIVSHAQEAWLPGLLAQLAQAQPGTIAHVIVTHNVHQTTPALALASPHWPFRLTELVNPVALGFGANHNQAFELADTPLFCILNPDISIPDPQVWAALASCASRTETGCAFPILVNRDGSVQDSVRSVPTPWALLRRRAFQLADTRFDWASAAFWLVPSAVFKELRGFDTRYFMYCEDVDFCMRLRLRGMELAQVTIPVIHLAQRNSHRRWQHLAWHLRSLLRLWTQPVIWAYLRGVRASGVGGLR